MILKYKKVHPEAVGPSFSRDGDAGLDLTAQRIAEYDNRSDTYSYHTGIAVEIPEKHVGILVPRSSVTQYDLTLANNIGIIDSNYRGEIIVKMRVVAPNTGEPRIYRAGDRVAQLVIIPIPPVFLSEVRELSQTDRGQQGFGSSGW